MKAELEGLCQAYDLIQIGGADKPGVNEALKAIQWAYTVVDDARETLQRLQIIDRFIKRAGDPNEAQLKGMKTMIAAGIQDAIQTLHHFNYAEDE